MWQHITLEQIFFSRKFTLSVKEYIHFLFSSNYNGPLVHKEVASKQSFSLSCSIFLASVLWTIATVFLVYSAYYNSSMLATVAKYLQYVVLLAGIWFLYLWFTLTSQMHSRFIFFDLDKLEMDEYVTMVYMVPVVIYALAVGLWTMGTGDDMWITHSEMTLVYLMATHYFMFMSLTGT